MLIGTNYSHQELIKLITITEYYNHRCYNCYHLGTCETIAKSLSPITFRGNVVLKKLCLFHNLLFVFTNFAAILRSHGPIITGLIYGFAVFFTWFSNCR